MSGHIAAQVSGRVGDTISAVPVNAIVSLLLAGYLIAVMAQGNLTVLLTQIKLDLFGDGTIAHQPFYRWAIAFVILAALAHSRTLNPLFGPLFFAAIVAMLVTQAQTGGLAQLNSSIKQFFGFTQSTTPAPLTTV